ncbi:SDR family oxidoreductase [Candidatus Nitrosacidococcus sp. I8]|uniref:SDR family oxidoreductase n=1 Tax=Candidatus Nitrosacidococcus sp. I8 TaxID=2942908 RepID=UPI00222769CB|nr:SDR family oxidoreductase [Candidatus Nitrosacidococcus sp. I8]CAH9018856.1 3-phenylpropionate-dihydrodiol/cinnamic acid-dihydrodiol dehydrogenase [Candidatus Nitrosacidococcus sp. I8]
MSTLLITGANRGIGLEFVTQYIQVGWRVLACCRNPDKAETLNQLESKHHNLLSIYQLDISYFTEIEELAVDLFDEEIDVFINNAGIYPEGKLSSYDLSDDNWIAGFKINAMAPLKMAQLFAPQIAQGQQKKIINITSKMGSIADNTSGGSYLYRSSKAALNMITKSLAIDLAPQEIATAVLHPGWVQTEMGGAGALITTQKSVAGMRQVIEQLTLENSGKFYDYTGKEIPW